MMLSHLLRSWRLHNELTVREAADKMGLKVATYSRIERGKPMDGAALAAILTWMVKK